MSRGVRISFYGVRGSTPCAGPELARYGGNTSCVVVESAGTDPLVTGIGPAEQPIRTGPSGRTEEPIVAGDEPADEPIVAGDEPAEEPIVMDLGTGLRVFGREVLAGPGRAGFRASVLLTHLHWDHVQGLPFFGPLACGDAHMDVYGPAQMHGALRDVFAGLMSPPYFPIRPDDLAGTVSFRDTTEDEFAVGHAKVRSRWVRHTDPTLGFRVEWNGCSIAYLSDHAQGIEVGSDEYIPDDVLELSDGVDVLIHDAQHTSEEFEAKRSWGHCTVDYAMHVAREAGARTLVLFHHDPAHDDDAVDELLASARRSAGNLDVVAAHEGLVLPLVAGVPAAIVRG